MIQSSTKHISYNHGILEKVGDTFGKGGAVTNSLTNSSGSKPTSFFHETSLCTNLSKSLYSIKLHKGGN